jgi:uncharacterized protein (TIGR02271 family)
MQSDQTLSLDRLTGDLYGATVYDSTGDKIGTVEEIFYDDETNQPEWIGIGTGFFGTKRVLVPVAGANTSGDGVTVRYDKDQVKGAPDIDGDRIDEPTEAELYAYYGLQRSERRSNSGLPAGGTGVSGDIDRQTGLPNVDEQSLTRSEEELHVGKREVEAGRVRLRKWVETEPVQATVELERETVHVHREPIDQPTTGADIGEQEIEVTLHEERPVVAKETVARERISLDRDVETETERVSDEVRKERIEVDGDVDQTGRRPAI